MNPDLVDVLTVLRLPKEDLHRFIYLPGEPVVLQYSEEWPFDVSPLDRTGITYFGLDSEDEGTRFPELKLLDLVCSATDVVGLSEPTLLLLHELAWICGTELEASSVASPQVSVGEVSSGVLPQVFMGNGDGADVFWSILRRYAGMIFEAEHIRLESPTKTFIEMLEVYGFWVTKS